MDEKQTKIIKDLVELYERNLPDYKAPGFKEDHLRQEFINHLFEALGWDVGNTSGAAPAYRDVIHEDSIKMTGGGTKAPDYCFTLSGVKKFFVETKKPSVDIKKDPHPAYQLRRYAWSAELPVSILTNFEELAVYESRRKPKETDRVDTELLNRFNYKEYVEKWDEISSIFSKTAILQGSFDKFLDSAKQKRGAQEVGDEFLKEIEGWRDSLARNIAVRNPQLSSVRELNYAVQSTIDRIIFLRMCEDRGIEQYGQLQDLLRSDNIYKNLCKIFEKADEKYNSGLFHFAKERGRNTPPDEITLKLSIDDKVLRDIIGHIYYPESPYEFSVLRPEILGYVYEQFLGKVIRLTEGHHAKIEEKPEVKKAGGVYYTPEYIVDYIVDNTVRRLCEGKTPQQIEKLHFLDPACGSGSFLLGVYTYLLDYHLKYYTKKKNPKSCKEQIYQGKDDQWFLTIKEKKRILLNNIYGVDIDNQAVEVTKLSLLLKVLEGTSRDIFEKQQKLWPERALPDLVNNIKCGNSLISPDFYDNFQTKLIKDNEEIYRINAFDWNTEFKEIMDSGGFDAVVGNPPYVKIQTMKEWAPVEVEAYKRLYSAASSGNYDIYIVFLEKGFDLLNKYGRLGYILPHKFFQAQFGKTIRKIISSKKAINEIVHFGAEQVFPNATTYTCLLFLSKMPSSKFRYISIKKLVTPDILLADIKKAKPNINYEENYILQPLNEEWNFYTVSAEIVLKKLRQQPLTLADITRKIFVGLQTSADEIYVLKVIKWQNQSVICYSKSLQKEVELERGIVKPFLMGKDIHRYNPPEPQNIVIFPYSIQNNKAILMSPQEIQKQFPKGWQYLLDNKDELGGREKGKMQGSTFYAYIYPKNLSEFDSIKIMTPDICKGAQLTIDETATLYHTTTIYSFVFKKELKENPKYFLGVLNSKLLWFFLKSTGSILRGDFIRFKTEYLNPFPIRTLNLTSSIDRNRHDKMVELVTNMLELHKQLLTAREDHEKIVIQRQINSFDQQIDKLVYELYGLTKKEIAIVEES